MFRGIISASTSHTAGVFTQLAQTRGHKRLGVAALRKAREAKLGILPYNLTKKKVRERNERYQMKLAGIDPEKELQRLENLKLLETAKTKSPSLQYPARLYSEEDLSKPEIPEDDVYCAEFYQEKVYSIEECIAMHRELAHPQMMNNLAAFVKVRLELNMNTGKKKKYVNDNKQIIILPYPFVSKSKRTIFAFAKDPKIQELAKEAGAEMTGGTEIVKKITKGQYPIDDIDYFVCHIDMLNDIGSTRGLLKSKFPSKLNNAIGSDIEALVKKFVSGTEYEVKRDEIYPDWGLSETQIATLDMPTEQIEANVRALVRQVATHRESNTVLGHFINRALLMVSPGEEYFAFDFQDIVPLLEAAPAEKKKKNKKFAAVV